MGFKKPLSASEAIQKLADNDASFTICDLSNNAVRRRSAQVSAGRTHKAQHTATRRHCAQPGSQAAHLDAQVAFPPPSPALAAAEPCLPEHALTSPSLLPLAPSC